MAIPLKSKPRSTRALPLTRLEQRLTLARGDEWVGLELQLFNHFVDINKMIVPASDLTIVPHPQRNNILRLSR